MMYTTDQHGFTECCISRNTTSFSWRNRKRNKWKEAVQNLRDSRSRKWASRSTCGKTQAVLQEQGRMTPKTHMWTWRQRSERLRARPAGPPQKPWGQGTKTQRIFQALMELALLSLDSLGDPSTPFSFPLWKMECLSCTCLTMLFWKKIAIFSLHRSTDGIFLSVASTQSHTPAWHGWFRGWDLELTGDARMG